MRHSKPALAAAILALLPSVSAVSESTSRCIRSQSGELADLTPCPDAATLSDCLDKLGDYFIQTDIENCLIASGCSEDQAAAGATALLYHCEDSAGAEGKGSELRKRQRQGGNQPAADDEEEDPVESTPDDKAKPDPEEDDKPAPADEDKPKPDTEEDDKPAPAPAPAPAKTEPAAAPAPTEPAAGVTPPPALAQTEDDDSLDTSRRSGTECFVTSTVVEEECKVENGENTCSDRTFEKTSCLDGWLCRQDGQGNSTCMRKINKLDTGGIIVALVFAGSIVVSFGLMIFFCCRDRSAQKKRAAKLEAAAIAKAGNVGKQARSVSDRQPLMAQGPPGAGADGQVDGVQHSGYGPGAAGHQQDPFTDHNRY